MRVDSYMPSSLRKMKMMIDHFIVRNAASVMCNGPYLEDQLIDIGVKRRKLIKFGLPYKDILSKKTTDVQYLTNLFPNNNACTILYVGRIEEKKGVFDLIEACQELLLEDDNLNLMYIGNGSCMVRLKRKAKDYGISEKVLFCGQLPHETVVQVMRHCDILVIPTRLALGEGRCKSAIEGLVLGIPIIVPNYGAFQYLVKNNRNGMFYEPDNTEDLKRKIIALVYNTQERQRMAYLAKICGAQLINPKRTFIEALNLAGRGK
jgi:glycosyltransferase involved in cell wall biosynthesis